MNTLEVEVEVFEINTLKPRLEEKVRTAQNKAQITVAKKITAIIHCWTSECHLGVAFVPSPSPSPYLCVLEHQSLVHVFSVF